jgi:hypothetical protein
LVAGISKQNCKGKKFDSKGGELSGRSCYIVRNFIIYTVLAASFW